MCVHPVDSYTYVIDVLLRISIHPDKHAIELTQWMWKSLVADAPLRYRGGRIGRRSRETGGKPSVVG